MAYDVTTDSYNSAYCILAVLSISDNSTIIGHTLSLDIWDVMSTEMSGQLSLQSLRDR